MRAIYKHMYVYMYREMHLYEYMPYIYTYMSGISDIYTYRYICVSMSIVYLFLRIMWARELRAFLVKN